MPHKNRPNAGSGAGPRLVRSARRLAELLLLLCCSTGLQAAPDATAALVSSCAPLHEWQDATGGRMTVSMENAGGQVLVRFAVEQDGSTVQGQIPVSADTLSAVVLDDEDLPQYVTVCADRWFLQNLPQERGGLVLSGERVAGGLLMQQQDYAGDDEDALTISLVDGKPQLATGTQAAPDDPADDNLPPLLPSDLRTLTPEQQAQMGLTTPGCSIWNGVLDNAGHTLAVTVVCEADHGERRVWLLQPGTEKAAVAATPGLGPLSPNSEAVLPSADVELVWDLDTLYATTWAEKPESRGDPEAEREEVHYSATLRNGSTRIAAVPERVRELAQWRERLFHPEDPYALADDDGAVGETVLTLGGPSRRYAAWLRNAPDDAETYTLLLRDTTGPDPAREIARGGTELPHLQFDALHLVFPSDAGIQLYDLATGQAQAIAGTRAGDWPLAWNADTDTLAWIARQPCGGQGADGAHLCLAHINAVQRP